MIRSEIPPFLVPYSRSSLFLLHIYAFAMHMYTHINGTLNISYRERKREGERDRKKEREITLDRSLFNIERAVLIFSWLLCNLHSCGIIPQRERKIGAERKRKDEEGEGEKREIDEGNPRATLVE